MTDFFSASLFLSFLGCLTLGILYAWMLYRENKNLSKNIHYGLIFLRIVVVATTSWLLFSPLIKSVSYTLEKPLMVIGQDNSLSIGNVKSSDFDQKLYEQNLRTLKEKLSDEYEVKTYSFSDKVVDGLDFKNEGKLTDVSKFFKKIREEFVNRNIGAVVLATDGIFNRGGNPLYTINQINAPIYTVALGDSIPQRDLLISNVNYNNIVYLDDSFTVEVQVKAFESNGESTKLNVNLNGSNVGQQAVVLSGNSFVKTVPIKLTANKIGIQKYTLSLTSLPNEVTTKNNSQTFFIEVIDGRQKVLIASSAPHPDLGILREAISANKHYESTLSLGEDLDNIEPSKFDMIVLYQLPDVQNLADKFLQRLSKLKKPIWYIVGAKTNATSFNQIQKQISIGASNGVLQEIYPEYVKTFNAFNLTEQAQSAFSSYDPLLYPFGKLTMNVNATIVFNQKNQQSSKTNPLLFFTNEDGLKAGYLLGEGLWRWKLSEAEKEINPSALNDLISKTIQYLSVKDDKRKFKVFTSKSSFDETESIQFNGTLYNDSYQPINEPEVVVLVKNDQGKTFNYTLTKTDNAYQLDAGAMPAGNYSYLATTSIGKKKLTASGRFYVSALVAEYQQTTANHQLLYAISKQSNGKFYLPKDLLQIADEIIKNDNIKTISYEDRKYEELINLKWLFGLILLMLSLEWFLRKRNGEI